MFAAHSGDKTNTNIKPIFGQQKKALENAIKRFGIGFNKLVCLTLKNRLSSPCLFSKAG
jgi:hypothetical protein